MRATWSEAFVVTHRLHVTLQSARANDTITSLPQFGQWLDRERIRISVEDTSSLALIRLDASGGTNRAVPVHEVVWILPSMAIDAEALKAKSILPSALMRISSTTIESCV